MSASLFRLLDPRRAAPAVILGALIGALWIPNGAAAQDTAETAADSAALGETPAAGEEGTPSRSVRLTLGADDKDEPGVVVHVDRSRVTKSADYVRFGENIHIRPDERIAGDVVVIGGSILVEGSVSGDCVAVGGGIELRPGARVTGSVVGVAGTVLVADSTDVLGDVVSVWGNLDVADPLSVGGEQVEVRGLGGVHVPFGPFGAGLFGGPRGMLTDFWSFLRRLFWVVILAGLGVLAFQIFPSRMQRITDIGENRGLVAFLAGFAGWILWLPAFLLLTITIIGIPLAILLLFLTPVFVLLGYVAVAASVGQKLNVRFAGKHMSGWKAVLLGVFALEGTLLVARLIGVFGSIFDYFGWILAVIGYCVIFIAGTTGFGAFLMSRFRSLPPAPAGTAPPPPMGPVGYYSPPAGSPPPGAGPPGTSAPPPGTPPPPGDAR
jgi:hypothetical protein